MRVRQGECADERESVRVRERLRERVRRCG